MITVLIVDDEKPARAELEYLLKEIPDISIAGIAEDGPAALTLIEKLRPDLVFMDIKMPEMSGFEVAEKLQKSKKPPGIIFTTAYDKFAIKAFDENAVAYLLKPIEKEKLKRAIEKSKLLLQRDDKALYEKLLQFVEKKNFTQFVSKFGAKVKLIPKEEVCYISAKDKHTFIHLNDGNEYIVDHTLSELELVIDNSFLRIHRGWIININFIFEVEKAGDGRYLFTLKDSKKSQLQSSTSYALKIRECLGL